MCILFMPPTAAITFGLLALLLSGWWLATALERRYQRREIHRRLIEAAHVHRWDADPPVDGMVIEHCACGAEHGVLAA